MPGLRIGSECTLGLQSVFGDGQASRAAAGRLLESFDAFSVACGHQQLISTFQRGGTARQVNLLVAEDRHSNEVGKMLEDIGYRPIGELGTFCNRHD